MRLLLISNTPIVIQIFNLVCKKLGLEFIKRDDNEVEEKYDLIIIDKEFVDDRFNIIKQYSKKLGAIVSEELPFEKARDFVIPRPFLPNQLQSILEEHIQIIKEEEKEELINNRSDHENATKEVIDYVESLADDIALDIDDETDESIITVASLKDGGILDNRELSIIQDMLHSNDIQNEVQELEEEDWLDLSDIIDKAIDDVKDYEFDVNLDEPIRLLLNDHNMDELKPLLTKLDQSIIDQLIAGEVIDIQLKLKEKSVD
ncbi:MAG: hypothetical protein HRT43_12750 [Campylobacteraceae bacterium]|nr:hypothetical protein [Campylobacteraceae bacterium]